MPRNEIAIGGRNYVLDARPDRVDHRDLPYRAPLISLPSRWPKAGDIAVALPYITEMVRDQHREGACTGFGLAATFNFILWQDQIRNLPRSERGLLALELGAITPLKVSPYQLYHLARVYDEWEGEDYDGSSCRGAVKGFHKHGACREDLWSKVKAPKGEHRDKWQEDAATRPLGAYYRVNPQSISDLQAAIFEVGALYASARVHLGWSDLHDSFRLPAIEQSPTFSEQDFIGAHAFAIIGYEPRGFLVQNSWGTGWGHNGFAILPYSEWTASALDAWVVVKGAPMAVELDEPIADSTGTNALGVGEFIEEDEVATGTVLQLKSAPLQSFRSDSLIAASTRRPQWFWHNSTASKNYCLQPLSREEAYGLTAILDNNGRLVSRRVGFDSIQDVVKEIGYSLPLKWWTRNVSNFDGTFRLMLYFDGGLNSEDDSLDRICKLAPYFLANGIYPLFVSWRTSFLDCILGILDDSVDRFFRKATSARSSTNHADAMSQRVRDATDGAIEAACQNLLVKPVWTQMKQNAEASISRQGGLRLFAGSLEELFDELDGEFHLVGHSAGALMIGHLLRRLEQRKTPVSSCRLFAPACTLEFANDYFGRAVKKEILDPHFFSVNVLSDELERLDSVGPYGKSLLYLMSRALEVNHKEPILGMQAAWKWDDYQAPEDFWHVPLSRRGRSTARVNSDLEQWFDETEPLIPTENVVLMSERDAFDGQQYLAQGHMSFQRNIHLLSDTISQIRGSDASPLVCNLNR